MFQAESNNGLSHAAWLIPVDRLGAALRHGAESTPAGADIAQQHKRCGFVIPALANVRTLGRLAYGVQSQSASQLFEIVKVFPDGGFGPQPVRFRHSDRRIELDLNEL
jgi:hypothetical protein